MNEIPQAQRIKEARKAAGLTQAEFGDTVGVHRVQVAKWETDKSSPFPNTLKRIADATQNPVSWFLGDESAMLDLQTKQSPKTMGRLVELADTNDRSVPDEAAAVIADALVIPRKLAGAICRKFS